MNKIKILHYGLSTNKGGIEKVVYSWIKNMPDNFSFDFVYEGIDKQNQKKEIKIYNRTINVYSIPSRYKNPFGYYFGLKKIIIDNKYNYIHCHVMTLNDPIPVIIANGLKSCSVIYHCHSMYKGLEFPFKEKILQIFTKLIIRKKQYLALSCGEEAGKFMFKNKDFTIIENGIDTNLFKYDENKRDFIRKSINIKDGDYLIGHVGHMCFEKNYDFILSSFSKLLKARENYYLLLIGNMNNDKNILKKINELDISNNVIFTGMIDNVCDYYSAMDIFFLPSINEGFPVTLIEAQTNGLPCITSVKVTKETKISEYISYLDFNENKVNDKIIEYSKNRINRKKAPYNKDYDDANSSKKLFNFYFCNLK